jgi:hypothetical protein
MIFQESMMDPKERVMVSQESMTVPQEGSTASRDAKR